MGDGPLSKVTGAFATPQFVARASHYLHGVGEQTALETEQVLAEEFKAIWAEKTSNYKKDVRKRDQAALCLSGGGIRSAAFSLGVLQALAQKKLLSKFQYLSTVSGGGYVGGWLTRWIHEEGGDVAKVEKALSGSDAAAPPPILPQIEALRKNSNYLTPKVGIASVDTWTAVMLWVRNTLLNLFIFIPLLMLVVVAPNLYADALYTIGSCDFTGLFLKCGFGNDKWTLLFFFCLVLGFFLIAFATYNASRFLPSHKVIKKTGGDWNLTTSEIAWRIVAPALAWAFLVPIAIASYSGRYSAPLSVFAAAWAAKVTAYVAAWWRANATDRKLFFGNFLTWICVSFTSSAVLGAGIWLLIYLMPPKDHPLRLVLCLATITPLLVTLSHLLMSALYVGYRRRINPTPRNDDLDREWLGRVSGSTVFPALLWGVLAAACVILPRMLFEANDFIYLEIKEITKFVTLIGGPISGLFAVLGGKSAFSALDLVATPQQRQRFHIFDLAIDLATALFVAVLLMSLAWLEKTIAIGVSPALIWLEGEIGALVDRLPWLKQYGWPKSSAEFVSNLNYVSSSILVCHILIALVLACLVWISSRRIDVNRFSLHGIYRNRLIRAFLGGARMHRNPEPFTGFDAHDNIRMCKLRWGGSATPEGEPPKPRVLYPVVNVTLNLVGGENLAWQERMASSFIITPIACGSAILDTRDRRPAGVRSGDYAPDRPLMRRGAYCPSDAYGGNEHEGMSGTGISLGTAITISGAAKSPSEGYSSSPATAFLMTLFNVRLGAWLANPARQFKEDLELSGPRRAVWPLIAEMLGRTNERGHYLYLTDGGHFDNLGLYEMIRRRCRFIYVVDADQDEDCKFDDLGRSVRQVSIDFGVDIVFDDMTILSRKTQVDKPAAPAFAVASIHYPDDDVPGCLIYLKPSYDIRNSPIDVRAYAEANAAFPHETTLDQWFSESQFESYRRLGYYLANRIDQAKKAPKPPPLKPGAKKGKRQTTKMPILPAGGAEPGIDESLRAFFTAVAGSELFARKPPADIGAS